MADDPCFQRHRAQRMPRVCHLTKIDPLLPVATVRFLADQLRAALSSVAVTCPLSAGASRNVKMTKGQ